MFSIVTIWVPTLEQAKKFETELFPPELRDKMMERGIRLDIGIGTYLREGDVHTEGDVDKAIIQFLDTVLVSEGYRIFTLRPSTKSMVAEMLIWWNRLSQAERERSGLLGGTKEDLISFHHTLGQDIRNSFGLWNCTWYPEIVDGVDMSPEHPDAVSMTVIEEVWSVINAIEDEWNA